MAGWLDRQLADRLTARSVVVLDEAGMVPTALMERVAAHVRAAGGKLVVVGDPEQLQPVERGAAFRVMQMRAYPAEIREVMRQRDEAQRRATEDFASGDVSRVADAVQTYDHARAIVTGLGDRFNAEGLKAATEAAYGPLSEDEAARLVTVATYAQARAEAGTLWHEIAAERGTPEDHRLYPAFKEVQARRDAMAQTIAADLNSCRPWLPRLGIDGRGLAADMLFADGMRRAEAEAMAAEHAAGLGLDDLVSDGPILKVDAQAAARDALLADWRADLARDGLAPSRLLLAYTRADVAALNAAARETMRASGHLDGEDVVVSALHEGEAEDLAIAVGDRIMCLKNDAKLGVRNGSAGPVMAIYTEHGKAPVLSIALDGGKTVEIDTASYRSLQHGYASTIHRAQGVTVDRSWFLDHWLCDRHLAYVAMSRHRDSVRVFSTAATTEALARRWGRARSADAISDFIDPRELLRRTTENSHVRTARSIRPIADRFGLPRALRQSDAETVAARPSSRRADRLSAVPCLPLACHADRASLLLSRHAADRLVIGRARDTDAVRRAGLRSGAIAAPSFSPAASSASTTGESIMAASISGSTTRTADARDEAFAQAFDQTLKEYQALSANADRSPDQDDEREALADALRSMAGDDADEISALAAKRDHEFAQQIEARATGDMLKRPRAADLETWLKLREQHPDRISKVEQHGQRIDITLSTGQTLHDRGNRITSDGPITKEAAEVMALAAIEKGWTEVNLKGSRAEKEAMAEAMVARGVSVSNPELADYVQTLDRARELAADRRALSAARKQPDLANPQEFHKALSAYQYALVNGASPEAVRMQRADVIARAEAVNIATKGQNATAAQWAAEGQAVDTAQAAKVHVAQA